MLLDPYKRPVNYLRVSVTDRCDFRCQYCMSENMKFLPKKDLLSLEEIERIELLFVLFIIIFLFFSLISLELCQIIKIHNHILWQLAD